MATVPLRCVQTLRERTGNADPVDPSSFVAVGRNTEVELGRLDPPEAAAALAMWSDTRRMWNSVQAGSAPAGAWVRTRTVVHHARQDTGRAKVDLHPELAGLAELTELEAFISELLSSAPDLEALQVLGSPFEVEVVSDAGVTTATLHFTRPRRWPEPLGPGVSLCEAGRTLTIVARHAAWRDRAVRRLAELTVTVDELWGDPLAEVAA